MVPFYKKTVRILFLLPDPLSLFFFFSGLWQRFPANSIVFRNVGKNLLSPQECFKFEENFL